MRADFPSVDGLTWQGQRANTCPMESTDNSPDHASAIQSDAERDRRTLSNRRERKYARKGRQEYTRPDGTVSQHELGIRELLKCNGSIQRNGFNLAVEKLWARISAEIDEKYGAGESDPMPPVDFRPDAFLINEEERHLEIFEVEDWGPIRAWKREKMGAWWFEWDADDRHDWLPRLWLVNRYGMITTELPMNMLYLEHIASEREEARLVFGEPEIEAEIERLRGEQ